MFKHHFYSIPFTFLSLFLLLFLNTSAFATCISWREVAVNLTPRNELEIKWRVEETLGTFAYRVERSIDNVSFTVLGEISGLQQMEGDIRYSWNDASPLFGKVFYRIRQIKGGGEECLSPTIDFTYIDNGIQQAEMYPNPCIDYLHLSFYASRYSELSLVFVNEAGILVRQETVKVSLGFNTLLINVLSLPPGIYTVDLKNRELAVRRRLVIQSY
ncbi:MAG: hypothetical protein RI894_2370 [Bacteroidota bacterium]|jgi:hypothetical protein